MFNDAFVSWGGGYIEAPLFSQRVLEAVHVVELNIRVLCPAVLYGFVVLSLRSSAQWSTTIMGQGNPRHFDGPA